MASTVPKDTQFERPRVLQKPFLEARSRSFEQRGRPVESPDVKQLLADEIRPANPPVILLFQRLGFLALGWSAQT
jgi:hypothetical protein